MGLAPKKMLLPKPSLEHLTWQEGLPARNWGTKKGSSSGSWFRSKNPVWPREWWATVSPKRQGALKSAPFVVTITVCDKSSGLLEPSHRMSSLDGGGWLSCRDMKWRRNTHHSISGCPVRPIAPPWWASRPARFDLTTLSWWKKHQVPGDSIRDLFGSPGRWRSLIERHTLFTPKKVTIA